VRVQAALVHYFMFDVLKLFHACLASCAIAILRLTSRCTYIISTVHMMLAELSREVQHDEHMARQHGGKLLSIQAQSRIEPRRSGVVLHSCNCHSHPDLQV